MKSIVLAVFLFLPLCDVSACENCQGSEQPTIVPMAVLYEVVPAVQPMPRGSFCRDGVCHPPIPTIHPNLYVGYREAYVSRALRFLVPRTPPRYRVGFILE